MSNSNNQINFFVIGSQRCGTTLIDKVLRTCDQVRLPENKQTYFFDRNYSKGEDWYLSNFNFDNISQEKVGEIATGYCLPHAIPRLHNQFSHAKLILIVREPISRAFSNFKKRKVEEGWGDFNEALSSDQDLLDRGAYGEMIESIKSLFPREQVKILFYDDLQKMPDVFVEQLISFIGVNCSYDESLLKNKVNKSLPAEVNNLITKFHLRKISRLVVRLGFKKIAYMIIDLFFKDSNISEQVTISELQKMRILKSNKILGEYTKKDMSDWDNELNKCKVI